MFFIVKNHWQLYFTDNPRISHECSSVVVRMSDPEMLALSSPTGGGRSVNVVRSRTQATELVGWLVS
jgi:hypothetical protein